MRKDLLKAFFGGVLSVAVLGVIVMICIGYVGNQLLSMLSTLFIF